MSSIRKQPNGRWRARYRDPNGRSRSKTFSRKVDAQDFLDDQSTDTRRGEWVDPRLRRQSFDEWADRWWATTARLAPTTRRRYWEHLERAVRPFFGGRRFLDIDWMDVEAFMTELHGQGLGEKSIRTAVTVVSLIMKGAIKVGVRRDNPAAGHHFDIRTRKIGVGDVCNMDEVVQLVEGTQEWYRPAVWLLALCGLRPSELCGLKVSDVDCARQEIHVRRAVRLVRPYGDTPAAFHEGPPKTDAGDRRIPIPGWLCEDLAAMLADRRLRFGANTAGPDSYLVVTSLGTQVDSSRLRRVIKAGLRRAGLPATIRLYDLRHAHASMLFDMGANPLAVAARMGWADPAMGFRVYGHLFPGVQEGLTGQLDELRVASASAGKKGAVTPIGARVAGHGQDTRDTRKTRNRGQKRSRSAKSG